VRFVPLYAVALLGLVVSSCFDGGDDSPSSTVRPPAAEALDAVLYKRVASRDELSVLGVATGLQSGNVSRVEVMTGHLSSPEHVFWSGMTITALTGNAGLRFRSQGAELSPLRTIRLPWKAGLWNAQPSRDGRLIAIEPARSCGKGCTAASSRIYVGSSDGSGIRRVASGSLAGWTPDGRVLYWTRAHSTLMSFDLGNGKRTALLSRRVLDAFPSGRSTKIGASAWSADGLYVAFYAFGLFSSQRGIFDTVVLAHADGRVIRVLRSPYVISMVAWSPQGHRLAYTTSGFPTPHELFVLDVPRGRPIRLYATPRHFDWVTWSPDGRWLLLDDPNAGFHNVGPGERPPGRWRLVPASGTEAVRSLPRLGFHPVWCCPPGPFALRG
jgi:hypothetical protein